MKKLWIENIENPAVVYQETAPVNENEWVDKTNDAYAWSIYGEQVIDYWFVLGKIRNLTFLKMNPNYPTIDFSGWGTLTENEQRSVANTPYVPPSLRLLYYSPEEDWKNGIKLLEKSYGVQEIEKKGRLLVVEKMRQWVFMNYVWQYQMQLETSIQFGEDTGQLLDWFERFSSRKFYQWLTNEVGTEYENNGFMNKTYLPTQAGMEQLRDELLIIFNGE